jgi:hypothetical protein
MEEQTMKLSTTFLFFVCVFLVAFSGSLFADSLGDPFDGKGLQNPNWVWQSEPDVWDVGTTTEGWLHFVPKINQNLWSADTTIRLYQETSEEQFEVETHVVMDYAGDCIVAGLVALSPVENNWTTLKFWGRAGDAILQWQHKSQEIVANVPGSTQPAGRVEAYLRMEKDGDNYLGWWKKAEGDDWIEIKPDAPFALTPPIQIGVFGGICAAAGSGTIEYEYFSDLVNPFAVEPDAKLSATWGQVKSKY